MSTAYPNRTVLGEYAPPGWPRPFAAYENDAPEDERYVPERKPVPWIVCCDGDDEPEWTTFHRDADKAHTGRLCQVCGDRMGGWLLLGAATVVPRRTSGPGMHPRCMALAARYCPHLEAGDEAIVAFLYTGLDAGYTVDGYDEQGPYVGSNPVVRSARPVTRAEVRDLARRNPLGVS